MLFNSFHYLVFFPLVAVLYFLIPHTFRWLLLLSASYYFYAVGQPLYAVLFAVITTTNYFAGIWIEDSQSYKEKRTYLLFAISLNVGLLFIFKYWNFFNDILRDVLGSGNIAYTLPALSLILPLGISFHTFQALAYIVDVYRGSVRAERHAGIFLLFIAFFPQLVAGPIERSRHMLPQFHRVHSFRYAQVVEGLRLILWGFFKKLVVADNLAYPVGVVFGNPEQFNGTALALASLFFLIQIYADFSGYTDIARGSARILGFDLSINFRQPFFARSISEFWQRWHISLTSWFQDYVFTPLYLAFSRLRMLQNTHPSQKHLVAFVVATLVGLSLLGLWHGAALTFLCFGISQALFLIFYHLVRRQWEKLPFFIAWALTALMVLIGFIFFRSSSVAQAVSVIVNIAVDQGELLKNLFDVSWYAALFASMGFTLATLLISIGASAVMISGEYLLERNIALRWWNALPRSVRWVCYYSMVATIFLWGYSGATPFIYFQF